MQIIKVSLLAALLGLVGCGSSGVLLLTNRDLTGQERSSGGAKAQPADRIDRQKPGQADSLAALSPRWRRELIDTTIEADYLTAPERAVIIEINMLRTDPFAYGSNYLDPLRSYYQGKLLQYPGEIAISTKEGVRALDECIDALRNAKPLGPLVPKKGLTLAARDHARDQARTGQTGHVGSDGSSTATRLNRYGKWNFLSGENIDYGNGEARRIVTSLLIDDDVPSRGHRKNLLHGSFNFIGAAVGPHNVYGSMCVIDLAGTYD